MHGDGTSRVPASGDESLRLPPSGELLLRQAAAARPALAAGLATDGDFADGVIAHSGRWLDGADLLELQTFAVETRYEDGSFHLSA